MQYTVAEVAEIINLSRVSVYNKLKQDTLKPFIDKKQGVTYISEEGLKLIKDGLTTSVNKFNEEEQEQQENIEDEPFKEDLTLTLDYVNYLKAENERLWAELQEKNNQINNLSRLVENGQVLLKDKPQQDVGLLQERCDQTNEKIAQVKERMQDKQTEKKGVWNKLFGKKE